MKAFNTEIFTQFDKTWGLLCAGTMEHHNAMSISWGGMGTLWNKPVVTVYVNPLRYTYQFMEANEYFTVSFLPAELKKAHGVMGAKSGRDTDKDKEAHLTLVPAGESVTYAEAEVTLSAAKSIMTILRSTGCRPMSSRNTTSPNRCTACTSAKSLISSDKRRK